METVGIRFNLESLTWLDDVMFDGQPRRELEFGDARLQLVGIQRMQSTSEEVIVQFVLENVLTPTVISLVSMFLYEKLRHREEQIKAVWIVFEEEVESPSGKVTRRKTQIDIVSDQPEQIVEKFQMAMASMVGKGKGKKARPR